MKKSLLIFLTGLLLLSCKEEQELAVLPEIFSFCPLSARHGETVTITGKNFEAVATEIIVSFNGHKAKLTSVTDTVIRVTVPKNLQCSGLLSITIRGKTCESANMFIFQPTVTVSTFAGSGTAGFADGAGNVAQFNHPDGLAVDASGNVYVADAGNDRIRKIAPNGVVSTLAGSGVMGFADGTSDKAQFDRPAGMTVDAFGNVYVADRWNRRIRKITTDGVVSTIAGSGASGSADGFGEVSQFSFPLDVETDGLGKIFVADDNCIRVITPVGMVSTLTRSTVNGTGDALQFSYLYGVTVDASGNVYVSEISYRHRIRKITPDGIVSTLAGVTSGYADGVSVVAQFNQPNGIAADILGNIYVADALNHRIRIITPNGVVSTLAGSGGFGYDNGGFANGDGDKAQFKYPCGVAVDASGIVYVSDMNNCIRKIVID